MSKRSTSHLNHSFFLVIISFIVSFTGIFTLSVLFNTEWQMTGVVAAIVSVALLAVLLLSAFFRKKVNVKAYEKYSSALGRISLTFVCIAAMMAGISILSGCIGVISYAAAGSSAGIDEIKDVISILSSLLVIGFSPFLISVFFSESYSGEKFSKAFLSGLRLNLKKYISLLCLELSFFAAGFFVNKAFVFSGSSSMGFKALQAFVYAVLGSVLYIIADIICKKDIDKNDFVRTENNKLTSDREEAFTAYAEYTKAFIVQIERKKRRKRSYGKKAAGEKKGLRKLYRIFSAAALSVVLLTVTAPLSAFAEEEGYRRVDFSEPETQTEVSEEAVYPDKEETKSASVEEETKEREVILKAPEDYYGETGEPEGDLVEVTDTYRTFQTGPKSFITEIGIDTGTFEENGQLYETDDTLIEKGSSLRDKYYENAANDYSVQLPASISEDNGVKLYKDGKSIEITPIGGDFTHSVSKDNALLYNDVFDGIDYQYTVVGDTIKEDIVLNRPVKKNEINTNENAPDDIFNEFTFRIKTDSLKAQIDGEVISVFENDPADPVFIISAPQMTDARGEISTAVKLSLSEENGEYRALIEADNEWLASPERAFPVRIDPSTVVVTDGDIGFFGVEQGSPDTIIGDNNYPYCGYDDGIVSTNIAEYGAAHLLTRTYAKINYDFTKLSKEARIDSATFSAYHYTKWSKGKTNFGLYKVDQDWDENRLSWNYQKDFSHTFIGFQPSNDGPGWVNWDVREIILDWMQNPGNNKGFCIKAEDERNMQAEVFHNKNGVNKPKLTIEWSIPDPVDAGMDLDSLNIKLRPITEKDVKGKLQFDAVFADGTSTPESYVKYWLSPDNTEGYAQASASYKYPDSTEFEATFPNGTKYHDKQSNWQTYLYGDLTFDKTYSVKATAAKDGRESKEVESDRFLIYKVKGLDTFPYIANHYGVPLNTIMRDNRVQDSLVVENNTIFIRNPKTDKPYSAAPKDTTAKKRIDSALMGRGLHCEYGFEPVNLNTGNFWLEATDVSLTDLGDDFGIKRSYNSKGTGNNSIFGRGWSFEYQQTLSCLEDGSIAYTYGDGKILYFTTDGAGGYESPSGYHMTLTQYPYEVTEEYEKDENGNEKKTTLYTYEIKETDGSVKKFNAWGLLTELTDENGYRTTLEYNENFNLTKITGATGKSYTFETTESGLINKIILPDGNSLEYTYDENSNLTEYKDANDNTVRYVYDENSLMTEWYDQEGNRIVENKYDEEGRVTQQTDANGGVANLNYEEGKTTATDAEGNVTIYHTDELMRTVRIEHPEGVTDEFAYDDDNNLISDKDFTYTYDDRGNILTQTRSDGAVRTFTYNDENKETSITDYDGSVTAIDYENGTDIVNITYPDASFEKYTYDDYHRPLTHTDENGNTESYTYEGAVVTAYTDKKGNVYSFTYDAMNRLIATQLPDGTKTSKTYDNAGSETSDTAADGGVTSYTLNRIGNIIRITEPEGGFTDVEYDGLANILKTTDAKGNSVTFTYDKNNNTTSVTDGNGHTTSYEYDGLGRVKSEKAADGGVTSFEYDDHNNVTVKTDPYGNKTISEYDKAIDMPVSVTDVLGRTTAYSYDVLGNPVKVDNPDGSSYTYEYDLKSRITNFIDKTGIVTELEYDGVGNLLKLTENGERVYTYEYDKNGNLIKTKDPLGGTESYSFDALNREIKEVNAGGQETNKEYDVAGRLNKITDALGGVVSADYDKNGNVTSVTDARGGKTSYLYDAADNPVSETNALGAITNFTYDGESQLTQITDALKGIKQYHYDSVGNLSGVTDELGNLYSLTYDLNGNNTAITLPNGDKGTTEYDAAGRVIKTVDAAGLTTEYEYDDGDRLIHEKDNGGADNTYEYDTFGNLVKKTNVLGEEELYEYDNFGQVTAITETDGNRSEFTYDFLGRLTDYTDPEGNVSTFTYDALGNLLSQEESSGGIYKYAYDKLNRVIKETDPLGGESGYSYDANGNLVKATDENGVETSYAYNLLDQLTQETDGNGGESRIEYDALGRLSKIIDPEGGDVEYRYDAAGNRTKLKDRNGHVTEYIYDSIGNVIKEISPKGAETEYEYDKHDIVTKIKDALGHETKYETDINGMTTKIIQANGGEYSYNYDALQRLTGLSTPNGYEKSFTYDERGDIISEKDNLDRESKYTYDVMHRVKEITDPKGSKTAFDYDKSGNILSVLEANGAKTSFAYDLLDRVTENTDAEGKKTSYEYDKAGNITKIIKPGNRTTQFKYDNNYNLTQITDPLGEKVKAVYDKNDRVVKTTDQLGNTYKYTYDKEDQVTSVIDPAGEKITFEYDAHGNVSSVGNQLGAKQKYTYDLNDNLTKVTDPLGRQTQYEYDVMDNLTKITDAAGKESSFTYDLEGNMTSFTDAGGKTDSLTYDLAGNLKSRTRPDGKKVSYDYDKLNNLTQKEYAENGSKVLYLYDEMGNRTAMTDSSGDSSYTYDLMNRITSVTSSDGRTVKYTYDEADNLASITYPDGRVISYEYDLNDRLVKVTDGELVTTYTYDAAGRVTETIRPDGRKSVFSYNERDEIVSLENKAADDKVLSSFEYEYDATGSIVQEAATSSTASAVRKYEYNEADELTGFSEKSDNTDLEYKYEYDDAGNRTSIEIKGSLNSEDVTESINYEYNEEGLLISKTSSLTGKTLYEYDGNGNLIKKTGYETEFSYEYTVENRLKAVREGGELLQAFAYDGDGNRILQVARNERSFKVTNPLEEEKPETEEAAKKEGTSGRTKSASGNTADKEKTSAGRTKSPFTGDKNWYLEAFIFGTWQGTVNNLAAFNSSLAVKYTEDLREEWDDTYHGRVYNEEVGEIGYSKDDLTALENAEISDEDIDTIKSQEIVEGDLTDEEKVTIPGATYEVSERYYDLTRYVNDVNTDNTQVLQEFSQNGNLKSSHVYGNERIYSDVYDPVSEAFNVSGYNYDGRGSVVQTFTGGDVTSQLSYAPFGNLTSGEPAGSSYYGFNAEETSTLTGLQYLRARYYDTNDGRFITADDYLGNIQEPLTLNRYAYTANNPVRYNDPSGHLFGWIKKAASKISSGFKKAGSAVVSGVKKIASGVRKVASTVKNGIKKAYTAVKNFTKKAVSAVKTVAKRAYNSVKTVAKKAYSAVKSVAKSTYDFARRSVSYVGNKTASTFRAATKTFKNAYSSVRSTATNYVSRAVSGARSFVSGTKKKITNVVQRIATPFKALSGSLKNIFVSGAVAKKLEKTKEKIKKFFCGTAQKVGDFFKGVGNTIAEGAKAVGNFVKNINWRKVGDVAAIVGIGAASIGAIVITAGAATPVVAGIGYGLAAGTAAFVVADVQQTVTDGENNYIKDVLGVDQQTYNDIQVAMDIAGLGYTSVVTSGHFNKNNQESYNNINIESNKRSDTVRYSTSKLQHEYYHANDFGIYGNWNKLKEQEYINAINSNINNATEMYISTYRGSLVKVFYNQNTGVGLYVDLDGNYIGGWKFNSKQIEFHRRNGTKL